MYFETRFSVFLYQPPFKPDSIKNVKEKGKEILVQALGGSRRFNLPDFMTFGT